MVQLQEQFLGLALPGLQDVGLFSLYDMTTSVENKSGKIGYTKK